MNLFFWLKPGLQIKRWIIINITGIILVFLGLNLFVERSIGIETKIGYIILLIIFGSALIALSVIKGLNNLINIITYSRYSKNLGTFRSQNSAYDKNLLSRGVKVVVIGGGTGLSVLLRGLKKFTSNITAIVTVADDGGGSGKLREDLGMLPPGDIRNCILALADTEPIMEKLLQYRFEDGTLKNQSFGNLLIAAMAGISDNFEDAIKRINDIFAVMGKVLPVTTEDVTLYAKLQNGQIIKGESQIPIKSLELGSPIEKVFMKPKKAAALEESLEAIMNADVIVLGPGSLYTSILPNLLIEDIPKAIEKSSAIKVYVSNLMTQPGETDGYSLGDHVKAIQNHINKNVIEYVYGNNEGIPEDILDKYKEEGADPVVFKERDRQYFEKNRIKLIQDNFVEIKKGYLRHNAVKLSEDIINIAINSKYINDKIKFMELNLIMKRIKSNGMLKD
ncbi:MAG: hypothetical protein PWQ37_645 [Candidatus Petromonas sp.]|jgi:uncharacterized cofD-like protein|nr:hypothetical protein [Candidatus Petromonas sp.]